MDLLIRQMQGLEEHLLAQRQERSHVLMSQAVILFSAAFGVAGLLLGLHYYLLNYELKARHGAEESLQQLNARFQEIQDAERRRVARELHESVGQYLSSVKMNLESIGKSLPPNPRLAECVAILDKRSLKRAPCRTCCIRHCWMRLALRRPQVGMSRTSPNAVGSSSI
jgi:signal transduction histidine kinase